MKVPDDRLYTAEHEWAKQHDDGVVRVGITDYAQDALGDIVYVEPPQADRVVAAGESVAEIESTKSVADVYAPFAGIVTAVNGDLVETPDKINGDPYGDGWLFEVEPTVDNWRAGLISADEYRSLTEG